MKIIKNKSSSEKESLTLFTQKEIYGDHANERINEIQNSGKPIDFNYLFYYSKGKSDPKIYWFYSSTRFLQKYKRWFYNTRKGRRK